MRRALKLTSIAAVGGVVFQFGGICNALWAALPAYLGTELLLDSNILIDLFQDP